MPRRALAAYTLMFTAGITAGYFMFESLRICEAFGFIAASCTAVIFAGRDCERYRRKRLQLAGAMLAGFTAFTISFAVFESGVSEWADTECVLSGRVISAVMKDDRLELLVRPDKGSDMPRRVKLMLNDYSVHPATDESGQIKYGEAYQLSGTHIKAGGRFRDIPGADDPGVFDQRLYLRAKGVAVTFRANGIDVTDEGGLISTFRRYLFMTREDFVSRFDDETAGFIRGSVFGDKRDLDDDIVKEFNVNSTGHILAVSGLHMGFLYALLRILSGRKKTAGISMAIIAVMIVYGEMTLWSPATVRACMVMSISLLSVHFRRPFDLLTAVSLAALVLLVRQPYQLFDTGFRLSFLAMAGIAFLTKPVSSVTGEGLGMMIAVQAGTIPVTACTFCRINPLAVFINIPVILIASLMVPLCLLMLMCGLVTGHFPSAGIGLSQQMAFAVMKINHILAFDGGFSYRTAGFGAAAAVFAYVLLFGLSSEWTRVRLIRKEKKELVRNAVMILMPFVMLTSCLYDSFYDDEIVFVSVGQGDCTHVKAYGRDILIDGGGREDLNTGERVLIPYLQHEGCDALEIALVTHLHEDHYRGICELAEVFPVGMTGIPEEYRDVISGGDGSFGTGRMFAVKPGSRIKLSGDVYIDAVWPVRTSPKAVSADDPNEHNCVYMIHYRGVKIMVTGDLLEEDELEMIDHYKKAGREEALRCDILKVAHHGSRSSTSEEFLDAVSPSIAVIQAGKNNIYGHPHSQTLERLEKRGIAVYRTDINGAVGIDIRRNSLKVDVMRPSLQRDQS